MKKILSSYWLWFTPFLLLFTVLVLKLHTDKMIGDEQRYIDFANNLCHGFYSPKNELNLWNGPGYPIILMPFVALKTPLIFITLLNACLQFLSIILLYKSLLIITNKRIALVLSLCWGFYFVAYQDIPAILTEPLTSFMVTLVAFSIIKYFKQNTKKYLLCSGISIGFLCLTKVIFGYVLIFSILSYSVMLLINKFWFKQNTVKLKNILVVLSIALLTIAPYLTYTYSLTGKIFYLGNSGGVVLYWMSTPYENEYGEWNSDFFTAYCKDGRACNESFLRKNHEKDFAFVNKLTGVEKDDAFKKLAIENIKKYPLKYVRNWFSNLGRLWFGFPTSAFYQEDIILVRFIPNSIILTFFLLCLPVWFMNFKKIKTEINFLAIFIFLYLGATSLMSAYPRQLYVIVPILLLWFGSLLPQLVYIAQKLTDKKN